MNGLIFHACQWAPSHFGLPGTMTAADVKDVVRWLTEDGHFKYASVDVEVISSFFKCLSYYLFIYFIFLELLL